MKCFLGSIKVCGMLQMRFGCSHTTNKTCKAECTTDLFLSFKSRHGNKQGKKPLQDGKKYDNTWPLRYIWEKHEVILKLMIASRLPLKPLPAAKMHPSTAGRQSGRRTDASRRLQQCPSATFSIQPKGREKKANNHIAYIFSSRHICKEYLSVWRTASSLTCFLSSLSK